MKAPLHEASARVAWRRSDLWWLAALPFYQLLGTLRHEASHALAAVIAGGRVRALAFWPTYRAGMGWRWGYVAWEGPGGWPVLAAPYLCDLATYVAAFALWWACPRAPRWLRLNLAALGLVSPLVNTLYNYAGALGGRNDVSELLRALPPLAVHGALASASIFYIAGLAVILCRRPARAPSD